MVTRWNCGLLSLSLFFPLFPSLSLSFPLFPPLFTKKIKLLRKIRVRLKEETILDGTIIPKGNYPGPHCMMMYERTAGALIYSALGYVKSDIACHMHSDYHR